MFADLVHAAWYAVVSNRLRAVLTAASVAVAVGSVVALSSLARSGLVTMSSGLERMGGARLVLVSPKPATGARARYAADLSRADVAALRAQVPHVDWISAQTVLGEQVVSAPGRSSNADVVAGDLAAARMLDLVVSAGRGFSASDMLGGTRVALLAHAPATRLFARPEDAVGQLIRVGADPYKVVGLLAPTPPFVFGLGYQLENLVLIPHQRTTPALTMVVMASAGKEHNPTVAAVATSVLAARHREADDFRVFDFASTMALWKTMLSVLELCAGAIAGVALFAGAAGTSNVLMVSVHEQVREIGVRRALGAPGGMIVGQFLLQAMFIAAFGVLAGLALGAGAIFAADGLIGRVQAGWITVTAWQPSLLAVALAFVVTGLASWFPALAVRRLDILACLQAEA